MIDLKRENKSETEPMDRDQLEKRIAELEEINDSEGITVEEFKELGLLYAMREEFRLTCINYS